MYWKSFFSFFGFYRLIFLLGNMFVTIGKPEPGYSRISVWEWLSSATGRLPVNTRSMAVAHLDDMNFYLTLLSLIFALDFSLLRIHFSALCVENENYLHGIERQTSTYYLLLRATDWLDCLEIVKTSNVNSTAFSPHDSHWFVNAYNISLLVEFYWIRLFPVQIVLIYLQRLATNSEKVRRSRQCKRDVMALGFESWSITASFRELDNHLRHVRIGSFFLVVVARV